MTASGGRGWWTGLSPLPHPLPPPRNFVTSPQSPICHQYKMAPVNIVHRIDRDLQLRRLNFRGCFIQKTGGHFRDVGGVSPLRWVWFPWNLRLIFPEVPGLVLLPPRPLPLRSFFPRPSPTSERILSEMNGNACNAGYRLAGETLHLSEMAPGRENSRAHSAEFILSNESIPISMKTLNNFKNLPNNRPYFFN